MKPTKADARAGGDIGLLFSPVDNPKERPGLSTFFSRASTEDDTAGGIPALSGFARRAREQQLEVCCVNHENIDDKRLMKNGLI